MLHLSQSRQAIASSLLSGSLLKPSVVYVGPLEVSSRRVFRNIFIKIYSTRSHNVPSHTLKTRPFSRSYFTFTRVAAARVRMGGVPSSAIVFLVLLLVDGPPPPWAGATLLVEALFLEVEGVVLGVGVLTTVKGAGGTVGACGLVLMVVRWLWLFL